MAYPPPHMDPYFRPDYSESYKFIRMADDLHDVATYLSDMRLCFIALTITGYIVLIIYLILLCVRRNRRSPQRRRNWDFPENQRDFNQTTQTNADDLVSVRSDGQTGYMTRNHHSALQLWKHSLPVHTMSLTRVGASRNNSIRMDSRATPSFMRHGHMNHQQTTRLMADHDSSTVKHTVPSIVTEAPQDDKPSPGGHKVPSLVANAE